MKKSCYLEQDLLRKRTGQSTPRNGSKSKPSHLLSSALVERFWPSALHLVSASFGIFRHLKNDQIISNIFAQQPRCASRFLAFLAGETHSQISQLYKELALKIIRVIHQELLWILFAAQCVSSDRAPQIQLVYGSFQHFPMATWAYTSVQTRTRWYPPSCKLHILNPSKYYVANELDHHLYRFLSMFFWFSLVSVRTICAWTIIQQSSTLSVLAQHITVNGAFLK